MAISGRGLAAVLTARTGVAAAACPAGRAALTGRAGSAVAATLAAGSLQAGGSWTAGASACASSKPFSAGCPAGSAAAAVCVEGPPTSSKPLVSSGAGSSGPPTSRGSEAPAGG